ncbi:hypothetical protein [Roseitranquillus sediminis]|uniref:hypothetical protein n=1 Tax=Roseitranquillus sediminis TaxID=2809051 RepID=UPI001D0BF5BF|nr:hypothetical protein [Roseitranquillus sediminis]MBM9594343.1 hypothetical protein [Roseitranquillus sediminis]
MRPRILCLVLSLATVFAQSASAFCRGEMSRAEFLRLLSTNATPASVSWPEGVFPLGHPMDLVVNTVPQERLTYRVFAARQGTDGPPVEMQIATVAHDTSAGRTAIRVGLELPEPHRPTFVAPVSFVIVGCRPLGDLDALKEETDDPETALRAAQLMPLPDELVTFATGERSVSTVWMGVMVAGAALLGAVAIAAASARVLGKRKEELLGITGDRSNYVRGVKALFVDYRNRISLSHFQIFVFFSVVFISVAYVFGRTRQLSDLSEDVLYLLGISAAGGVAGKLADVNKNRLDWENWAWLKYQLDAFPQVTDSRPRWYQLVSTQGEFDVYRFQALCFTLLVAPAFVIMSLYSLGELSIPAGILAVLGLSQVTYIAGKVTVQPTLDEFNKKVTDLRNDIEEGREITPERAHLFMRQFESALELKWNRDHPLHPIPARPGRQPGTAQTTTTGAP